MNISIITHAAHGGKGGIDKYVTNIIDTLESNSKIKKINIYSKRKIFYQKRKLFFYKSNFFLFLILKNTINIIKSDLILITHINLIPYALVSFFFNKKIILFSYGIEIWGVDKNFIYKLLIKKINYFICMRDYTMRIQKKKYDLKSNSFFMLHNCMNGELKKYRFNHKQKNIITVARLDKNEKFKGIDETLDALSLIKKKLFKYYIVGEGNDTERLKKKVQLLNLENDVIFTGYVSNKKRDFLFRSSCICSMPGSDATFDTYPYRFSFLEASIFGLHLIASNPQKKEKKDAKKYANINFVNPKNAKEIKKTILKLINKKKYTCPKLIKDFSYNQFKSNLNKYINSIIIS